jgi:hypothetical protein
VLIKLVCGEVRECFRCEVSPISCGKFPVGLKVFSILGFSLEVMISVKWSDPKFELKTYQLNLITIFCVVKVRSIAIDVVAFGWL